MKKFLVFTKTYYVSIEADAYGVGEQGQLVLYKSGNESFIGAQDIATFSKDFWESVVEVGTELADEMVKLYQ